MDVPFSQKLTYDLRKYEITRVHINNILKANYKNIEIAVHI